MSRGIKDLREIICQSRLSARDNYIEDDQDGRSSGNASSSEDYMSAFSTPRALHSASSSKDSGYHASSPSFPKEDSLKKTSHHRSSKKHPESDDSLGPLPSKPTSLDYVMTYLDCDLVKEWLSRANSSVSRLTEWFSTEEHFVDFAHFWLCDFPLEQKYDILQLEHSVLMDELQLGFRNGLVSKAMTQRDLDLVLQAVLHEFPSPWLTPKVNYGVLDYLDVLTAGRSQEYRRLLTWVKLSTRNKLYIQWFLSIRSFGLINMLSALVEFYLHLLERGDVRALSQTQGPSVVHHFGAQGWEKWQRRTVLAISCSSLCTLKYLIDDGKIDPIKFRDSSGKNLVSLAVSLQRPEVLKYLLLKKELSGLDLNQSAENGNSPLHSAVTLDNFPCVQLLVENGRVDINSRNPQSGNVTPLHVAVLSCSKEMVHYLVQHGASPTSRNDDGLTPRELAEALGLLELEDCFSVR